MDFSTIERSRLQPAGSGNVEVVCDLRSVDQRAPGGRSAAAPGGGEKPGVRGRPVNFLNDKMLIWACRTANSPRFCVLGTTPRAP